MTTDSFRINGYNPSQIRNTITDWDIYFTYSRFGVTLSRIASRSLEFSEQKPARYHEANVIFAVTQRRKSSGLGGRCVTAKKPQPFLIRTLVPSLPPGRNRRHCSSAWFHARNPALPPTILPRERSAEPGDRGKRKNGKNCEAAARVERVAGLTAQYR